MSGTTCPEPKRYINFCIGKYCSYINYTYINHSVKHNFKNIFRILTTCNEASLLRLAAALLIETD